MRAARVLSIACEEVMSFEGLAPELVWGLIPRFVGVLYVLGFGALIPQHKVMAGARSLVPIALVLARIRRDFPGVRRFFDFPTVLWLNSSDFALRAIPVIGTLCGACAVYGGTLGLCGLALGWVLWLSLELRGLLYPWDTMLQEVGFLVLFLPTAHALPNLHANALPLPSVAFAFRWFVLRLMLGFGKDKFIGTTKRDLLYLRGFFVWMPLPTPLGWLGHHAPAWLLRAALGFMFVAEVVAPVMGLFTGTPRIVSFATMAALMLGIHATGNWGFFNIGFILLSVCLLDTHSSIFDLGSEPWLSRLFTWPDLPIHACMVLLFSISLAYLPNNSWFTRSWLHWPKDMFPLPHKWMPLAARVHRALAPLRALAPFRIVNGYGVFPPHSMAPLRLVPVFEGSDDGVEWKQYGYRHMPSFAHSRPPMIAPYHARLDQWTYYVTMGIDSWSLFGSLFPIANPYAVGGRVAGFDLMAQRILTHDRRFLNGLGHNPFPDAPPKLVRVGILGMTPTRLHELRRTGRWWHVQRFGTLVPARGIESWLDQIALTEPELFHPDMVWWKQRARPLRLIADAHAKGMSADRAVIEGSDLDAADVERFWTELAPMLTEGRGDWSRIHERAEALIARFGALGLYRLERVFERFAWLLRLRTERYRFGRHEPSLPVMSNFRYHMLLHEMVSDGRSAYAAALLDPACAAERAQRSNEATQIWALTLFRYDQVMGHVALFRSSEMGLQSREQGAPSFFEYYDFLVQQTPPSEEFCPHIVRHSDGEHSIEGFYPPPPCD